jgi:hypothetical protein
MDRFVPRDDGKKHVFVMASAARQCMDRFVPRYDGKKAGMAF